MAEYRDLFVEVGAEVRCHVRLYSGGSGLPAICLPGLTRNARDYDELAPKLVETGRNVAAISLRGRGDSDRDPAFENYAPICYRSDIIKILDALAWPRALFVGTSLGGIVTMLTNETAPERVAAAVINDVGPDLSPVGLARIGSYVGGQSEPASDIHEAAARIKAINDVAFPTESDDFWIAFARRTHRQTDDGWALDYDPAIAKALAVVGPAPDLWPGWRSLADKPTLLIHGALSDLLTDEIVTTMRDVNPGLHYARVPDVGHAPFMTESAAWSAIEAFLSTIEDA